MRLEAPLADWKQIITIKIKVWLHPLKFSVMPQCYPDGWKYPIIQYGYMCSRYVDIKYDTTAKQKTNRLPESM